MLTSAAQCESTLGMLMQHTDIARHVRHLVVRPHAKPGMVYNVLGNELASATVRRIAGAMVLDALKRFDWDDDELPFYEDMWFALRIGCVLLDNLFTTNLREDCQVSEAALYCRFDRVDAPQIA